MNNDQVIIKKIDDLAGLVTGRIDQLDERLSGRIDKLDQRLTGRIDELANDIKDLNSREDLLVQKVVLMDEKMDNFATKQELTDMEGRMMTEFDKQAVVLKRLDDERLSGVVRMDRIESRLLSAGIN